MTQRYRTMASQDRSLPRPPPATSRLTTIERGAVKHRKDPGRPDSPSSLFAALGREPEALAALFVRSPVPSALVDGQGRLREVNDALCDFLGRDADALIGVALFELTEGDVYGPVGPGALTLLLR